MDVIIDTNIIRKDLKLNDKNFEILVDYLNKTNSRIIFPSIVIEEIKGLYKRVLNNKLEEFLTSHNKLDSTLINHKLPEVPSIQVEEEVKQYINYVHEKLGTSENNVIEYKDSYLSELVSRAINRRKPIDEKGQEFRDGILWLTLLDYTKQKEEKRIALISGNTKDFADINKNSLNPELQKEVKEKNIEVKYFTSLNDFAREHASFIEYITENWIQENINTRTLEELFAEILGELGSDQILEGVELQSNESPTGNLKSTDYIESELKNFFVYEKSDGTIFLNLEFEFELEYEIEVEREFEKDISTYDYKVTTDSKGEPEMEMIFVPDYSFDFEFDYKYEYPVLTGEFVVTIKDGEILGYELKDWYWS